jgi:hypothetical protein
MKEKSDERAIRLMTAALLQSELTAGELRRLGKDQRMQERVFAGVCRVLRALGTEVSGSGLSRSSDAELEHFYDLVQRRRMSKSAFAGLLRSVRPHELPPEFDSEPTLRSMLENFLTEASPREKNELVALLSPGGQKDGYLDEILKR